MNKDLEQDITVTHGILNYLHAGYQGLFTQYNIFSRLQSHKFNQQAVSNCGETLKKIALWKAELNKRSCLFAASWDKPQTFEAEQALNLLRDLRSDLLNCSAEVAGLLGSSDLSVSSDPAKFLLASFGRFAYSREHYVRGFVELGQILAKQDLIEQYNAYLQSAGEDVNLVHQFLEGFKQADPLQTNNMLSTLRYMCLRLPGAFRAQAHDIAQLIARFRGGPSFDLFEIPISRATAWKDMNITASEAGYWESYFIAPEEALSWMQLGIKSHDAAANWRIHGFSPHSAAAWAQANFPVQVALVWSSSGFSPEKALECLKAGINDPKDALKIKPEGDI